MRDEESEARRKRTRGCHATAIHGVAIALAPAGLAAGAASGAAAAPRVGSELVAAPTGGARGVRALAISPASERRWNRGAGDHDASVAVAWFDLLYDRIRAERFSPLVAARAIGYAGVTLYEAVVPGIAEHRSLGGQLNGLPPLPAPDPGRRHHWPSAASGALAEALRGLFASGSSATLEGIDALEEEIAQRLSAALPRGVYADSAAHGRDVAAAVLEWAADDGYAEHNNCPYTPPVGPGLWEPTPPAFAGALQPCWGSLRPLALASADACLPAPPPAFSTEPGSDFYAEGEEVYATGNGLDDEQRAIALFWADNPGQTGTPPGHWISIVGQIARRDRASLATAAEAYARAGIGVADAFISCWHSKFIYNLLRPVTYVRDVLDAGWTPLIPTPPFPEYTSGHSVQSASAAALLTDLLGEVAFTDDTHASIPLPARSFDSFDQAAEEAAVSRLYGGIHFRSGIDVGVAQGRCVAGTILDAVRFRADVPPDGHGPAGE